MKKIILFIIISLMFSRICFGATQILKTVKESGGNYTSLESCLNDNEQNLVTADKYLDIEIGGTWSAADTTAVIIHNYTTDATRKITIYADSDSTHDGSAWKSGAYNLGSTAGTVMLLISDGGNYLTVRDIIFNCSGRDTYAIQEFKALTSPSYENLIMHSSTYTNGTFLVINTSTSFIKNIMLFDVYRGITTTASTNTVVCDNATALAASSSSFGILRVKCTNCYAGNFDTEDFFSLGNQSDYNVSSDTSAADEAVSTSATGKTSYSNYFENVSDGTEDLRLKDEDQNLWGISGTDLSGDFTDDIEGDTRTNWDIGCDEYVAAGPEAAMGLFFGSYF